MRLAWLFASSFLLVSASIGCGDDGADPGGGGQGGGSGGGATGGGGSDGGNGGGTGGDVCAEFEVPQTGEPSQPVTVRFVNDTDQPIYLGGTVETCETFVGYEVEDEAGAPVKTSMGGCEFTCAALLEGQCGCPPFCAEPIVYLLAANGGTFETTWSRTVFEVTTMPDECYQDGACLGACNVAHEPVAPLTFSGAYYTELADCTEAICDCIPDASGSCVVEGATLVSGAAVSASAVWSPGAGEVEVVFD